MAQLTLVYPSENKLIINTLAGKLKLHFRHNDACHFNPKQVDCD
jgi:hypothetical protein